MSEDPLLAYPDLAVKFRRNVHLYEEACGQHIMPLDKEPEFAIRCCHIVCAALQFLLTGDVWKVTQKMPETEYFSVHFADDHSMLVHVNKDGSGDIYQANWGLRKTLYKCHILDVKNKLREWRNYDNWQEINGHVDEREQPPEVIDCDVSCGDTAVELYDYVHYRYPETKVNLESIPAKYKELVYRYHD